MSTLTTWGYSLTGSTPLPDLITEAEFNALTSSRYAGDTRLAPNIAAASNAIRNYCGWHIAPNLECEMVYNMRDLRDSFVGSDLLIQLPSVFVTGIKSILLDAHLEEGEWSGTVTTDYDLDQSGLLRIYDVGCFDRRAKIRIVFDSGLSADQISAVKELTANRVVHAVVSSNGITSEAAGGVSVTYASSWASDTSSSGLMDNNKEMLESYRVKGVF